MGLCVLSPHSCEVVRRSLLQQLQQLPGKLARINPRLETTHLSPRGHDYTCLDSEHLLLLIHFPDGQTLRLRTYILSGCYNEPDDLSLGVPTSDH
jgi:hypothetical protein